MTNQYDMILYFLIPKYTCKNVQKFDAAISIKNALRSFVKVAKHYGMIFYFLMAILAIQKNGHRRINMIWPNSNAESLLLYVFTPPSHDHWSYSNEINVKHGAWIESMALKCSSIWINLNLLAVTEDDIAFSA